MRIFNSRSVYDALNNADIGKIENLINEGMDPNIQIGDDRWNLLHCALVSITIPPNLVVIQRLIELGVDVNARDQTLGTPLHLAVRSKWKEAAKLLIDAEAEVNLLDVEGLTPLHLCLVRNPADLSIIQMLLDAGADPEFGKERGWSAWTLVLAMSSPDRSSIIAAFEKSRIPNTTKQKQACRESNGPTATANNTDDSKDNVSGTPKVVASFDGSTSGCMVKYFYSDSIRRNEIPYSDPVKGNIEAIVTNWDWLSQHPGSFLGVELPSGETVQFMWTQSESVIIDISIPEERGSLQKSSSFEECRNVIINICMGEGPGSIPGLQFVDW